MNTQIAPQEILELHELLNTNLIGAKKLNASMSMASDEALKNFMKDNLNNKKAKIQELQNFINSTIGNQTNNQGNQGNQGNSNQ